MKITYDTEADAVYFKFRELAPGTAKCRELSDEIVADYGPDGKLAGIEILDASHLFSADELKRIVFEVAPVQA